MLDFKQIHDEFARGAKRLWADDRAMTVGASDVGQCARKVYFSKNETDPVHGAPRDSTYVDKWGATARGSVYENNWWEPALRAWAQKIGVRLLYAGADQKTFSHGFLSATPDGLLVDLPPNALEQHGILDCGSEVVVECKTIDPRVGITQAKPEHTFQVQVQMGLIRELTNHRPDFAVITYADTSFWDDVREFVIAFNPKIFEAARRRSIDIMTATNAFDLRPEGKIAGGRECDYCPFVGACRGTQIAAIPDGELGADPEVVETVSRMAFEARELRQKAEDTEAKAKTIQENIKALLSANRIRKVVGDGISVNWAPMKGRPSYDMVGIREAATAAGVDLSKFETAGLPTDRLDIRVKQPST